MLKPATYDTEDLPISAQVLISHPVPVRIETDEISGRCVIRICTGDVHVALALDTDQAEYLLGRLRIFLGEQ